MNTKDKNIADIIIVSYKNPDLTVQCVESIRRTSRNEYRLIIIDNASPDNTVEILKNKLQDVEIIVSNKNSGYAGAVNKGASLCKSEYIVISNNDVIYRDGVLDGLLSVLQTNDKIAVAGPAQEYSDGSWQISYGDFPGLKLAIKRLLLFDAVENIFKRIFKSGDTMAKNVEYVDGAVMFVRKSVFDEVGGFDEDFNFYSEEADFCYRVRVAGYRVISNQRLTVTHLRGGSNNRGNLKTDNIFSLVASKVLFCSKHFSAKKTKLCIKIEKIYAFLYSHFVSLLSLLVSGDLKKKLKNKSQVMNDFYNAWHKAEKDFYEKI
jgi:GT2 family glycosyltransferase